ncbi:MAG: ABC transporter ATP-binding protein [Phenylobacterium sp.]|uniref:ABC transporter ATP-binding protein n=1 Tax=Phenylobacterium sp. TaxID=1871053 RepID=UPI00391BC242
MGDAPIISARGLGKKYLIGHQHERERYVALRDVLARSARGFARTVRDTLAGRAMVAGDEVEEFWALRDVDFDIRRGDVVGVIGRNGAGKSTLLKVLSRITEPSEGRVEIRGRVASLLEVGTGFHPELTGRENIFLNGAILGMTRAEIRRKFDEIVAFAEVERFLDTPVKRYSSGMYVRLAFAVAAHLEPEILVIDEVLAVGDAEFQKKCLGKMSEVADGGRTVLFVSHNVGALLAICKSGIVLRSGQVVASGTIREAVEHYRAEGHTSAGGIDPAAFRGPLKSVIIEQIAVNDAVGGGRHFIQPDDEITVRLIGVSTAHHPGFQFGLGLNYVGGRLLTLHDAAADLEPGPFEVTFHLPRHFLRPGEFSVCAGGSYGSAGAWTWADELAVLEVTPQWSELYLRKNDGLVNLSRSGVRTHPSPSRPQEALQPETGRTPG